MDFTWQPQKRGVRLIVDGQHVKTVSKILRFFINEETISKLSFDKKRVSETEKELLFNYGTYNRWLTDLSNNEKHVYSLIKNCKPIARRFVETPTDTRKEIIFENGTKIKVPDKVFLALTEVEQTATARLNY